MTGLNLTNSLLQRILESFKDLLIVLNAQGDVIYINRLKSKIFGILASDLISTNLRSVLSENKYNEFQERFLNTNIQEVNTGTFRYKQSNTEESIYEIEKIDIEGIDPYLVVFIFYDKTREYKYKEQSDSFQLNYEEIFNATTEAIYIFDYETSKLLDLNEATAIMYGYTKEEMLQLDIDDFSSGEPPYSKKDSEQLFETAKKDGEVQFLWCDKRKDNTLFWTDNIMRTAIINGKQVVMVMSRDITEQIKTDEKLKEKEMRYRHLFNHAVDGILVGDERGRIINANHSIMRMSGYSSSELMGESINILFDKDELERVPFRYDLLFKGESVVSERFMRRKFGDYIPVEMNTRQLPDGRLQAFFRDLRETKRAQLQLKESEQTLRRFFQHGNLGNAIVAADKSWIDVNDYLCKIFGYSRAELLSLSWNELTHPDDLKRSDDYFDNMIKGTWDSYSIDKRYIKKNGEILYANLSVSCLRDENNKVQKVFSSINDITIRKETEKELIHARERAIEADRLKSAFLANMSHEIRTPMNAILGFAQMLQRADIETEKRIEYTRIINNSGEQLIGVIDNLLDISKIETGQMTVHKADFVLNEILRDVYETFKAKAVGKPVEINLNITLDDEKSILHTDKIKLKQVLINLLSNALKFTKEGEIELGYELVTNSIKIFVRDTGIGISQEMHQKIFERFRQVEVTHERRFGGAGLGLSISKGLVEILGGSIHIDSEIGKGSTFYFYLPYSDSNNYIHVTPDIKEKQSDKIDLSGKTILIVEDEDLNFVYFREILRRFGPKLLRAEDGEKAVQICRSNDDIELVLMDIKLPDMNGYDATRLIKEFRKDLPIIAQTAFAMEEDREKALEAGCDDYLTKPVNIKDLISKITEFLA